MRRGQFLVQRGHSFGGGGLSTRSLSSEATFPGGVETSRGSDEPEILVTSFVRARRPPSLFYLLCQALVLFSMVRPGRGRGRAGGRAHG